MRILTPTRDHRIALIAPGRNKNGSYCLAGDFIDAGLSAGSMRTIYLSRAGSDANTGEIGHPVKTFQAAFDILATYGPVLQGRWRLQATAGTYPEPVAVSGLLSAQPIGIFCPSVAVNAQPSVIIDGDGVASRYGWQFQNYIQLYMEHLEFKNWTYDAQASGLYLERYVSAYLKNVWFTDNHWGVEPKFHCHLTVNSGKYEGNVVGAYIFTCSTYSFGANATSVPTGPILLANTDAAIRVQEVCGGHVDWCTIDGNAIGVDIRENARASFNSGGDIKNNTVAVRAFAGGIMFRDETIDWHDGDGDTDANTRLFDFYSAAQDYPKWFKKSWQVFDLDVASHGFSSGTANVSHTLYSNTMPAQELDVLGRGMRMKIAGFFSGLGTKTVNVFLDTTLLSFSSTNGSTANFEMNFEMFPTSSADGTDAQRVRGNFYESGQATQTGGTSRTIDMTVDQLFTVFANCDNDNGGATITKVEVETLR